MKETEGTVENLNRVFRVQLIIAISIFLSLGVFLVVEELVRYFLRPFLGWGGIAFNQVSQFRYFIYGVSVGVVVLIRLLQAILLRLPPHLDFSRALARLSSGTLIPLVLAEIPAILGFGFFLLTGLQRDFYVLGIVSVILLFMYFPRKAVWQEKLAPSLSEKRG